MLLDMIGLCVAKLSDHLKLVKKDWVIFFTHTHTISNDAEIYDVKSIERTNEERWREPQRSRSHQL